MQKNLSLEELRISALYSRHKENRILAAKKLAKDCEIYENVFPLISLKESSKDMEVKMIAINSLEKIASSIASRYRLGERNNISELELLGSVSFMKIVALFHPNKRLRIKKSKKLIDAFLGMLDYKSIEYIIKNSQDSEVINYGRKKIRELLDTKSQVKLKRPRIGKRRKKKLKDLINTLENLKNLKQ